MNRLKTTHLLLCCFAVIGCVDQGCASTKGDAGSVDDGTEAATSSCRAHITITNKRSIEGYADRPSYAPGNTIKLAVHAPEQAFEVQFIRYGKENQNFGARLAFTGSVQDYNECAFRDGAGWPFDHPFVIPENWPSGLYAAELSDATGANFRVPFVLRRRVARLLVLTSTMTWETYNTALGSSYYHCLFRAGCKPFSETTFSFHRPNPHADPMKNGGHLAAAELTFLSWLEKEDIDYDLASDWDLHFEPELMDGYAAVILNTHPEYWSSAMRAVLEGYLGDGGNLLYLGGNGIYRKIEISGSQFTVNGLWRDLATSEAALLGVQYNGVGYDTYASYKVIAPDSWVFAGTDLEADETFGEGASGWETDKAYPSSPANVIVLARGTNPQTEPYFTGGGADMIYYDHPGGGLVFSAGSLTFAQRIPEDPLLAKIIHNVLTAALRR